MAVAKVKAQPKAYSYLRFSTPEQSKGDSTRRQNDKAALYAKLNGLDLDTELRFDDKGVSGFRGKNATHGALAAFQALVQSGDIAEGSYLLVENLDRVSRLNAFAAVTLLHGICSQGVNVVTLTDGRVYSPTTIATDDMALLYAIIGFMRAHDESKMKSQRIGASWKGRLIRARDGETISAIGPAWLKLDPKTRTFSKLTDRVRIVKRIFRETLKGRGQHTITEALNSERVPMFGRGKYWHRSYVAKILRSRAVLGEYLPHTMTYADNKRVRVPIDPDKPIKNYYPAIITREDFARVQLLIKTTRAPLRGRHANGGDLYNLFASVARCGKCGGTMTLTNKGAPPKGARYFVCAKAKGGAGCKYKAVRYERVELALRENVKRLLRSMPAGDNGAQLDEDIERTNLAYDVLGDAIENLLEAAQGGAKSASFTNRLNELESDREVAKAQLLALLDKREGATSAIVKRRAADLEEALSGEPLNRPQVNALMRQVFESVTVDYQNGLLVFAWRHGGESDVAYSMPSTTPITARKPRQSR